MTRTPERPLDLGLGDVAPDRLWRRSQQSIASGRRPGRHALLAAAAKLDADFTGFVQLLAASGDKVAQGNDHPAGGAYYPTSLWRPGELLRDVFTVTLPSSLQPGAYTILAGMYRTHEVTGAVQEMAPPLTLGKIGMLPDVARPATDPERPLNVELGDRILLLGYSLRRSDTALEVILQWHATVTLTQTTRCSFICSTAVGISWRNTTANPRRGWLPPLSGCLGRRSATNTACCCRPTWRPAPTPWCAACTIRPRVSA
ncbi:hypothetical protein [Candidatus Amarolinea dominans]|uniref:hypothetical protein n=1 Tax=Candidatus Amarolinea dominans TaxID=3140696 RepID=UPI001E089744|nr:hypothetical protein [Anaerolineae bacterium]